MFGMALQNFLVFVVKIIDRNVLILLFLGVYISDGGILCK